MKILDKYVAKNFITGYLISMMVLVGLRVAIDLFVNLDEFAESNSAAEALVNVLVYYSTQSSLYFRDFAGMITVVAAVFSLGKMTRNNELTAVMASGVSLKRVIAPIIILAVLLTGLLVIDQELIIPKFADKLVKSHDSIGTDESYSVWFMADSKGSLISTPKYDEKTKTMSNPFIIVRTKVGPSNWIVEGQIKADSAIYVDNRWVMTNGVYRQIASDPDADMDSLISTDIKSFESDLTPNEIPMKRQESYKSLLSFSQLNAMTQKGVSIKDKTELYSQKHQRITDPIINIIMLMIALPVLVCRDPKAMKSAILKSFTITGACYIATFASKMLSTESLLTQVGPEFWAWLPVFIFFPIGLIELDSMKT